MEKWDIKISSDCCPYRVGKGFNKEKCLQRQWLGGFERCDIKNCPKR